MVDVYKKYSIDDKIEYYKKRVHNTDLTWNQRIYARNFLMKHNAFVPISKPDPKILEAINIFNEIYEKNKGVRNGKNN